MDQDRLFYVMFGFELREQLIEVVNIPGTLHLWQHDHVELVADLAGLVTQRGLFQRCTGRPGDATHCRDIGQLTDPLRHLLEVR